jgi:hypothetical protein
MPVVVYAVLCNEVREDEDGLTSVIGILEKIILLGERPTVLNGIARVYAESAGEYPFRAAIVAPSGKVVSDLRYPMRFDEDESDREVLLNLVLRAEEEGTHWLQVSIGSSAPTRVPLGVRWAPDVRKAR